MGLPKGRTNNKNGRKKGIPNKVTSLLREQVSNFLAYNWDKIQKDYEKLEPKDRLMFYERLLKYSIPPLQNLNSQIEIINTLEKLSDEDLNKLTNKILDNYE